MQGVFIKNKRPKSKKEIKEALATMPEHVYLERTALIGDEYGGPVMDAPDGTHTFVGPDPYTKRSFYGNIIKKNGKVTVK